jgi:L-gulono-1,4-lactone dehydrogenase
MARAWQSWSGLTTAHPAQVLSPTCAEQVADAVLAARHQGLTVKMVGSGHSFTDVAAADGLMLRPSRLAGVTHVDRDTMTVTARAGTPLHQLNAELTGLGLSLHNMGDIDRQTLAGAISTGTHGSGRWASLSSQVAGLELVTADGAVVQVDADHDPDLFQAARVGLGALGVLTAITFRVEPAFLLEAKEGPLTFAQLVRTFDELVATHHHVDVHWFPYSNHALVKRNDRTLDDPAPLSRTRAYVDDELLANQVFGLTQRLGNRVPRTVVPLNRISSRALTSRTYTDLAPKVFVAQRKVRFKEMEYAVPAEVGMDALIDARRVIDRGRWPVSFPVEIRYARAEEPWLSTAHGRDTVYLAFHVNVQTDHVAFFRAVEGVMRDHGGRPHWGKLHTRTAHDLSAAYPRWADVLAVRDRVDPDRVFTNRYLDRVLGR